jgi:PAT family beta-lactamase induction signal transducer AmpG
VGKLATLLLLYFAQGLPFGFQGTALPLLLRSRGVSLSAIGFVGLLAAPWLAKALWAPWVDRYGSVRFGRRKSWIVPMQAALALCSFVAARVQNLQLLFGLVFLMNLFAATQDIAVDGLAVSWLEQGELGLGNAFQVVGYKLGMLTGGGLLVWASQRIGFSGLFDAMGVLMLLVMLVALRMREPVAAGARDQQPLPLVAVLSQLRAALRHSATVPLLAVVMTYKMGETLGDAMWKPMLFDHGWTAPQIGLWTGTYGTLASLLGSFGSGLWLRSRSLPSALLWTALLRAGGVAAEWWLSLLALPTAADVIGVTCIEHFLGGSITTVMFALMMRHTDRQIGGTHYTLLASLEVWGKLPFGALSGVIAQHLGYPVLYGLATGLCVAFAGGVLMGRSRLELPLAAQ